MLKLLLSIACSCSSIWLLASASPTASTLVAEDDCGGCADTSGNFVTSGPVSDLAGTARMIAWVTQYSGACFELSSTGCCVEEYPCTPFVQVYLEAPLDWWAGISGYVGDQGLTGGEVKASPFPPSGGTAHADYHGVKCGASIQFGITLSVFRPANPSFPPAPPVYVGSITGTCMLSCDPCSEPCSNP